MLKALDFVGPFNSGEVVFELFADVDPESATVWEDTAPLATESAFDALIVIDASGFELEL